MAAELFTDNSQGLAGFVQVDGPAKLVRPEGRLPAA
jgi:hypothetical protein